MLTALRLLILLLVLLPGADTLAVSGPPDEAAASHLARALRAAKAGDWDKAQQAAAPLRDPLVEDYLAWRRLLDRSTRADFADYRAFMDAHPDWPGLARLQIRAESALDESVDVATRLAFFAGRTPLTRQGRIRLAEALLATGDREGAAALARESWVEDDFPTGEERFFLSLFGAFLTREDHLRRLDRLLWDGHATSARRMFPRVDDGHRRLAEARLALQAAAGGVDRRIAAVPAELRDDPGLLFDRLRWRRRKGFDDGAREILMAPPVELGRPSAWWYERAYQVRELIDEGDPRAAYDLARRHGQRDGIGFAEAEWLTGWLALRHAGDPESALVRFMRMFEKVRSPVSRARAAYWAGRAAAKLGRDALAVEWYERAARHPTTFYGQAASAELGREPALGEASDAALQRAQDIRPIESPLARLVLMLCDADAGDLARPFLDRLLLDAPRPESVVGLAAACRRPDLVVRFAKSGVQAGVLDPIWSYPVPALHGLLYPVGGAPSPSLMLALARQESHFDLAVQSPVGAMGMMQLMPGTARAMASELGLPYAESRLRYDAGYNLMLGGSYIARLLERYDGYAPLAIAAYNAGPRRVAAWIEAHGDPRRMDPHEAIDWMELIPYRETRNYVQRVLETETVYAQLLERGLGFKVTPADRVGPVVPPPVPAHRPRGLGR